MAGWRKSRARNALSAFSRAFLGEGCGDALGIESHPVRPRPPAALFAAVAVWFAALAFFVVRMELGLVERGVPEGLHAGEHMLELISDAKAGDFGMSAHAKVMLGDGRSVDVLLSYEGDNLYYARERIVGWVKFSELSDASFKRYASEGIACRARAKRASMADDQGPLAPLTKARRWAFSQFDQVEGMGSALLRAVLTGDRSRLEEGGLYDAMKTVGLAHMVAVSGAHLAVVGAFLSAALVRFGVPRKALVFILCAFYVAYAVFTGLSAPVIRAGVMAAIAISCVFAARRACPLAALSVCICVLIAIHPANALSLSFFLSAASTFGVVVFTGLFASWMREACGGRARAVCDTLAMTGAANLPIFPVTACVFARIPLMAFVANLAAAPAFSVLLMGGFFALGVSALIPEAGSVVLRALCMAAGFFCEGAMALSRVPFAAVPCSMGLPLACALAASAVVALWAWWPRLSGAFVRGAAACTLAAMLAYACISPKFAPDEIVMLDVGQGDAILIRSQGASLLVDTGNQDAKLLSALARHGVFLLDGVAITHHDDDHCGSLPVLDSTLALGGVYLSAPTFSCGCEGCGRLLEEARRYAGSRGVQPISPEQRIRVGRFLCTAVWPREFAEEGGNADSLCLLVEYDAQGDGTPEARVLLTGDAEAEQFSEMVEQGLVGHVDVFKAGHHGSKNGADEEAFAAFSPAVALISVGEGNSYGHPAPETLAALEEAGAQVFRTDEQGDVACRFSEGGVSVFAQHEGAA